MTDHDELGSLPSRWYACLNDALPPDVARLSAAGRLADARRLIEGYLAAGAPARLEARLRVELDRLDRVSAAFPFTRERAIECVRREWPGFSEVDLDRLIDARRIDWRYVDGEQMIIEDFLDSLRMYPDDVPGLAPKPSEDLSARDAMLDEMRERGFAERRITLRARLSVTDERLAADLPDRRVRAWLPLPRPCTDHGRRQQYDIEVLDATPGMQVAPELAHQRTAYWEATGTGDFTVTYAYTQRATWHDMDGLQHQEDASLGWDEPASEPPASMARYLGERQPHIAFTPLVRELARDVWEGAGRPRGYVARARAVYDWVTGNVDYRFQPPYALLDCIPQQTVTLRRADCGVFALTFITLCRLLCVPARWQSGLYVRPGEAGSHDWAQFWVPDAGWLWADCSFGSAGRRTGDARKRAHYFGNLDCWRMVANDEVFAPLTPPFDGMRDDPFDNQRGEMSIDGVGVRSAFLARPVEVLEMAAL